MTVVHYEQGIPYVTVHASPNTNYLFVVHASTHPQDFIIDNNIKFLARSALVYYMHTKFLARSAPSWVPISLPVVRRHLA